MSPSQRAIWLSIGHAGAIPAVTVLIFGSPSFWVIPPALVLSWFVWPIVLLRMRVRGWRLFVPLAFGFLTSGVYALFLIYLAALGPQI
jgi:hypothetical protein